jgi:hypothetical protein
MRTLTAAAMLVQILAMAPAFAQTAEEAWIVDARAVSMSVPPKLLAVLQDEIARSGPEGAIAACHGAADTLSPAVQARLRELYPQDLATGYKVGDIRGAMTLKKPAPQ